MSYDREAEERVGYGASAAIRLFVSRKSHVADDIFLFEMRDPSGAELPVFTPGSHVTITTPMGQKRSYSLCNDPRERDRYVIAVKRDAAGRGGSLSLTSDVAEGDTLAVDFPRNAFAMATTEPARYIFIAGGIGITPIRSMIRHLIGQGRTNFTLYYLTREAGMMAFREEFAGAEFADKAILHHDGGDPEAAYDLWPVLEEQRGAHLYCCGPKGLMEAVRDMTGHWPDSAVHFEDFTGVAAVRANDRPVEIRLAGTQETISVPAGTSILEALRRHGLSVASSCESGTCGTCRTRYLAGRPDHRDLVLSDREKKSEIIVCVSRAYSPDLTLDIGIGRASHD